jgi:hypothetical protein
MRWPSRHPDSGGLESRVGLLRLFRGPGSREPTSPQRPASLSYFIGLSANPRESLGRILIFSAVVLLVTALALRGNWRGLERGVRPLREELESWAGDLEEFEVEGGGDDKN